MEEQSESESMDSSVLKVEIYPRSINSGISGKSYKFHNREAMDEFRNLHKAD